MTLTDSQIDAQVNEINRILAYFDKTNTMLLSKITEATATDDDDDENLLGLRIRIIAAAELVHKQIPSNEELKKLDMVDLWAMLYRLLILWNEKVEKERARDNFKESELDIDDDFER